jgi:hypothetical protein
VIDKQVVYLGFGDTIVALQLPIGSRKKRWGHDLFHSPQKQKLFQNPRQEALTRLDLAPPLLRAVQ